MTIRIEYENYTLFDIEWYMALDETKKPNEDRWYSEMDVCVCVRGIAKFLKEKLTSCSISGNFNLDEFIKDSEQIQELRGWLWETHNNSLCDVDSCEKRHYHVFKPELDAIIKTYCDKYGFSISVD